MKKGEGLKAAAGGSIQGNGVLGAVDENLRLCVVKGCRVAFAGLSWEQWF